MLEVSFKNFFAKKRMLSEGGNIFSDRRITKIEVVPTLKKIEELTGLSILNNTLGSTGKAETSGDLDIVIDSNKHNKDQLIKDLIQKGVDPTHLKKTGIEVAYKAPIYDAKGNKTGDYIQADLMFHDDPEYLKFYYANNETAPLKGAYRNILLSSIAKTKGLLLSMKGLFNRETKQFLSKDPNVIAKTILGKEASEQTLVNIPSILTFLKKNYSTQDIENMVKDAEQTIGLTLL